MVKKSEKPEPPLETRRGAIGVAAVTRDRRLGRLIEEAMASAAAAALADGITDPAETRARMLAARERAKDVYFARVKPAADEG